MLRFLRIRNLAVVEAVDVEFSPGFTVLTGETGAGKSILVEAVGLLLGGRASSELVRTGESSATIEALFEDGDQELVIRREVTTQGRSRSFVNGELVTNTTLKALSARLVELHGQHEHQALLDPATHLPTLDAYGRLDALVTQVGESWRALATARAQLDQSRMDERERRARLDLISMQLAEINRVAPKAGEDDELAASRRVLMSAERVRQLCSESYTRLYDHDDSVLAQLAGVWKRVAELAEIDPAFTPYLAAREGVKAQLEDLASTLRHYGDGVDASPQALQQVEDRLAALERLKRKYAPSLEQVIAIQASLTEEHARLSDPGRGRDVLEQECEAARERYLLDARKLSAARKNAARTLGVAMERVLGLLAMGRARVEMRLENLEPAESQWGASGIDGGELFIAPNQGEDARPLARIVSGGELSRVMLALKTLAAEQGTSESDTRTLVFDEVDAGIGGQVATEVARHLQALGERFQVLCVTHLPQIAARAETHVVVRKGTRSGRTQVTVDRATGDARVDELARMIGGSTVTEPIRASARELLEQAPRDRAKPKEKAKGESESRRPAR